MFDCDHCDYSGHAVHDLRTATIECPRCHYFSMTFVSQVFRAIEYGEIKIGEAAALLTVSEAEAACAYKLWRSHFYPATTADKLRAWLWNKRVI